MSKQKIPASESETAADPAPGESTDDTQPLPGTDVARRPLALGISITLFAAWLLWLAYLALRLL